MNERAATNRREVSRAVGRRLGIRRHQLVDPGGAGRPPVVVPVDPDQLVPGRRTRQPPGFHNDQTAGVLVIGGGIAGMSAAVILAERGVPVVVCEAAERLGGRLASGPHRLPDGTTQWIDHGFHGFFRQYYNWRSVLSRLDQPDLLRPVGSYPVISRRWPPEEFDRLPPTPPLSVAALVIRSPSLRIRELIRVDHHLARTLLAYDPEHTYQQLDTSSAEDLMSAIGLSDRARAMLFNVFGHSFFNDAATMSAADLVSMFHFYFLGNPEGLGMDAPVVNYHQAIWEPLTAYLADRGGRVECGSAATGVDRRPDGTWEVRMADGHQYNSTDVVLALDAASAGTLLRSSPRVTAEDARLAVVADRPPVAPPYAVARYWLDGDVDPRRAPFTSIGDPQVLDSITLYHRWENETRAWHDRTGGAVVELHAYAAPADTAIHELAETMRAELAELWPETAPLGTVDLVAQLGWDAAGFPVGGQAHRPEVKTALHGLTLAGDWVDVPIPSALMERSATSGILAANTILIERNLPPEPIWAVPPHGLLAKPGQPTSSPKR